MEMRATTQWERQQQNREQKLDAIREQTEKGTLVIRKMTAEERRRHPPREKRATGREHRS
jgi:hypothetical protein